MATTTATVTPEGLTLPADFMAELNLRPGAEVIITVAAPRPRSSQEEIERLIEKTRGMFAHLGGGMAEELIAQRREDERRFQAKQW